MKLTSISTLFALALGFTAVRAEDTKITVPGLTPASAAAPAAPAANPASPSNAQMAELVGWIVAKQGGLGDLEFSKDEVDALNRGFALATARKGPPSDPDQMMKFVQTFMEGKQKAYGAVMQAKVEELKKKNQADSAAFFAKLKETNKNVVELPSGLRYEIIQPGTAPNPKAEDMITAHYTGKLLDGTTFDSSVGKEPISIGLNQVVPGWTEGIQKIGKGGKIKLYIPSQLGYGDDGSGDTIPPGSTLVFDVELLDFKAAAPAPAMSAPTLPAPKQ